MSRNLNERPSTAWNWRRPDPKMVGVALVFHTGLVIYSRPEGPAGWIAEFCADCTTSASVALASVVALAAIATVGWIVATRTRGTGVARMLPVATIVLVAACYGVMAAELLGTLSAAARPWSAVLLIDLAITLVLGLSWVINALPNRERAGPA